MSAGVEGDPVDLDAAAPPASRPPAAPGAGAGRRPRSFAVWLLVAALVGAGVGAAVTSRHVGAREPGRAAAERSRSQADRDARAVLALQAGTPILVSAATAPDPRGRSTLRLGVPVSNRGEIPLLVDVRGLDVLRGPRLAVAAGGSQVFVVAGATTSASVTLVVRCQDVLSQAVDGGAPDSALRVSVEGAGRPRRAALPLADSYLGTVAGLVASACGPPLERRAPVSATWTPRPDGSLEVAVVTTYTSEPLVLDLAQDPGLGVRSDGALPAESDPDQSAGGSVHIVSLVLRMEPTCSAVAAPDREPTARLDVVTVADGRVQAAVPDDSGVEVAWVARRLALVCG